MDYDEACPLFAANGYCNATIQGPVTEYFRQECPLSCGICKRPGKECMLELTSMFFQLHPSPQVCTQLESNNCHTLVGFYCLGFVCFCYFSQWRLDFFYRLLAFFWVHHNISSPPPPPRPQHTHAARVRPSRIINHTHTYTQVRSECLTCTFRASCHGHRYRP